MKNEYYIYELLDPRFNIPFYVGKGKNNRMHEHFQLALKNKISNNNYELFKVLKELIKLGLKPKYNKIIESISNEDAIKLEREWISFYGINNLCNLTPGGEGGWDYINSSGKNRHIGKDHPFYGKKLKPETIEKMKFAKLGKTWEERFGKEKTKEIKKRVSILTSGKNNGMYGIHRYGKDAPHYGKKHSEETKLKISQAKLGSKYKIEV
jgi:hypothetical protein